MRKIAICNQKGGVAKTTTAINIATYLSLNGKKTLLIDLDPQANATSGVGINKDQIELSIYDVLQEQATLEQATINTAIDNLSIVPSTISLTGASIELVNALGREYRLKKAVQNMGNIFDYIIIDCPPSLGLLTVNGLAMADAMLIPIQCEYYALEGLGQLVNTVNLVKENINTMLEIDGVVMTMADFRTHLTKEVIDEVKKHFGNKVFETVIPRSVKLSEAPGFGQPIALYEPASLGAQKYSELTKELLNRYNDAAGEVKNKDKSFTENNLEPIEAAHNDGGTSNE